MPVDIIGDEHWTTIASGQVILGSAGGTSCTTRHHSAAIIGAAMDAEPLGLDCKRFSGIEKKHLPHVLCMTNLMLHGIDVPSNVRHGNTLARPLTDWKPKEYVDCIVTNPPFGGMGEDGIKTNLLFFTKSQSTKEVRY